MQYLKFIIELLIVFPIISLGILSLIFGLKKGFIYGFFPYLISNFIMLSFLLNWIVAIIVIGFILAMLIFLIRNSLQKKHNKGAYKYISRQVMRTYTLIGILLNIILIILAIILKG